MQITLADLSIASVLPACVLSIVNFRKNNIYYPFLLFILCSGIVEFASLLLRHYGLNNLWLYNINILVQFYFIMWQLKQWRFLNAKAMLFTALLAFISITWAIETILHNNLIINDYSLIFSSFLLVILFVAYINRLIFEDIPNIIKDSRFLISVGFLIYFTVSLIIFIFTNDALQLSPYFRNSIWAIHNMVNIFTNIIFAIALIWMPTK